MGASLFLAFAFLVIVFVTIGLGVRIVPQGNKLVVQRLGKYHTTLGPGLNLIIPYVDSVAYKVTTKDIVLDTYVGGQGLCFKKNEEEYVQPEEVSR